jgi:hypothetical protein
MQFGELLLEESELIQFLQVIRGHFDEIVILKSFLIIIQSINDGFFHRIKLNSTSLKQDEEGFKDDREVYLDEIFVQVSHQLC